MAHTIMDLNALRIAARWFDTWFLAAQAAERVRNEGLQLRGCPQSAQAWAERLQRLVTYGWAERNRNGFYRVTAAGKAEAARIPLIR